MCKDVLSAVEGKGELESTSRSLLEVGRYPAEASYAVKAIEGRYALGLQGRRCGSPARDLGAAGGEKPASTSSPSWRRCKFEYDLAVEAGEAALRVDPTDARWASHPEHLRRAR